MSKEERNRLLNDKWPEQSKKDRAALLKALKNPPGLFETEDHSAKEALTR